MGKISFDELLKILSNNNIRIKGSKSEIKGRINELSYLILEDTILKKEYNDNGNNSYTIPLENKKISLDGGSYSFIIGYDDVCYNYKFDDMKSIEFSISILKYSITPITIRCEFYDYEFAVKNDDLISKMLIRGVNGEIDIVLNFYLNETREKVVKQGFTYIEDDNTKIVKYIFDVLKEHDNMRNIINDNYDKILTFIEICTLRKKKLEEKINLIECDKKKKVLVK